MCTTGAAMFVSQLGMTGEIRRKSMNQSKLDFDPNFDIRDRSSATRRGMYRTTASAARAQDTRYAPVAPRVASWG